MSYRIEYDGRAGKYEVKPEGRRGAVLLAVLGAALALAVCFSPEVRTWLIPGEDAVTVQAFHIMTDDLRSGATISDAVEAFCRFVIHGQ